MRLRVALAYLSCCVLWGSTWVVAKVGLEELPALRFAALRFALALVVAAPFALRAGLRQLPRRDWVFIAGLGLLNLALPHGLMFIAQRWVPAGLAAVFFATFPLWTVALGWWLLPDESLGLAKLASVPLGLLGIGLIQGPGMAGDWWAPGALLGGVLVIVSAMLIALSNVLLKRRARSLAPSLTLFVQIAVATLALSGFAVVFESGEVSRWSWRSLSALFYLATFGTVGTYLTFFWLLPRLSLAAVGAIPLLDTLVAVALGTWLLREPLDLRLAAGAGLILLAAALANAPQGVKRAQTLSPGET